MKRILLSLALIAAFDPQNLIGSVDNDFQKLIKKFVPEYQTLDIPEVSLSYLENFKKIQNLNAINRQETAFLKHLGDLKKIDRSALGQMNQYNYDILQYQLELGLKRTKLEKYFKTHEPPSLPTDGIRRLPQGKQWYQYYINSWTSADRTPSQLTEMGTKEIVRTRKKMQEIQKSLGYQGKDKEFYQLLNSPKFTLNDESELKARFHELQRRIINQLPKIFARVNIPDVDIEPIPDPNYNSPPGYYDEGTFFYNFYENKFPLRTLEWLFLHEAIPGHHYQANVINSELILTRYFKSAGYSEGWAAYVENLGSELGVYQDLFMEYGKWEWDLVRSARVVLDVGINYQGWSRTKALNFWKKNVPNQDSIAEREIDRIIQWPAQVLTYKVGEQKFLELQQKVKRNPCLELKDYHSIVLFLGAVPLQVLEKITEDFIERSKCASRKEPLP